MIFLLPVWNIYPTWHLCTGKKKALTHQQIFLLMRWIHVDNVCTCCIHKHWKSWQGKHSGEGEHQTKSYTSKLRFAPSCFLEKTRALCTTFVLNGCIHCLYALLPAEVLLVFQFFFPVLTISKGITENWTSYKAQVHVKHLLPTGCIKHIFFRESPSFGKKIYIEVFKWYFVSKKASLFLNGEMLNCFPELGLRLNI